MTTYIGIRFQYGSTFVVLKADEEADCTIEITDVMGEQVSEDDLEQALLYTRTRLSRWRQQVHEMLKKIEKAKKEREPKTD